MKRLDEGEPDVVAQHTPAVSTSYAASFGVEARLLSASAVGPGRGADGVRLHRSLDTSINDRLEN